MADPAGELESKALKLPRRERARLAERLISSLDQGSDPDAEKLWLDEAENRLDESNLAKIVGLVRGADLFFCESPFLEEDVEQESKRYHLTARQAGVLGREAGVRRLEVFHFSPRYEGQAERIYAEARAAFQGRE